MDADVLDWFKNQGAAVSVLTQRGTALVHDTASPDVVTRGLTLHARDFVAEAPIVRQTTGHVAGRPSGTGSSGFGGWRERVALVVLLRGVNVGGHRTFRPAALAKQLQHLDVVNIGAAGTFVIRRTVTMAHVRAELVSRLPFDTEIMICQGREIVRLMSQNHFAGQPSRADIVRFVSVLSRRPRQAPPMPMNLPPSGTWLLRILAREDRFVLGQYRRHMKAIGYLGTLDRLFGVPVTTRNWNTMTTIARVLGAEGPVEGRPRS